MNDAQLHAPAVADIDNLGILVTNPLRLFGGADFVDFGLGDDGCGRRVSRPGLGVERRGNQIPVVSKTFNEMFFIVFLLNGLSFGPGFEQSISDRGRRGMA